MPAPSATADDPLPPVLVIDDELGMREGMRRVLAKRGFTATTAETGAAALALAEGAEFPLALVDLKMPGMDGFEVIERLRAVRPETICIVVSAFATIESAVQSTKKGAFDFVVKPFAPDDLLRVVDRAVSQWRLAREAARLRREREAHLLELTQEKTRLRTILQSMGEGLLVVNIDREIVLDNPVARRFLGRVQEVALPRRAVDELIVDERFRAAVGELLADGHPQGAVVLELQLEARHLRATLAAVRDEAAHVLGVVVLFTDISDAKALEHMKTLFVSMVAHEIKAPLGAVEGYLNLILAGDLDRDPERRQQVVTRCLARTGALLALVQDLLEITRRDSGRLEKRLEPVDLVALVDELVQFHGRDAAARQITLTREAPAALPRPVADRNDLERVLTNLLSNAVKYNRDGGRVTVRLASTGGAVTIEVADTGIGMSEAERARLGEEFYRAKNARTRLITGTGLGVALVKKILDSYNGALEIASVPGEGSTFRVLLPAPGAPAAVTDGAGARPGGAAAGRDHAGPG